MASTIGRGLGGIGDVLSPIFGGAGDMVLEPWDKLTGEGETDKVNQRSRSGVELAEAGAAEKRGSDYLFDNLQAYEKMMKRQSGDFEIDQSRDAAQSYQKLLETLSREGAGPTDADISSGNSLASRVFGVQREQLNQSFADQLTQANRDSAIMGREGNDPILRAKLAQEQTRQSRLLDAQQGAFGTNWAMQQPYERLNFAGQRSNFLQGLATQAMANRQALAAMGQGVMENERGFRLNTAQRWGNEFGESGGGRKALFRSLLATAGAVTSMMSGTGSGNNNNQGNQSYAPTIFGGPTAETRQYNPTLSNPGAYQQAHQPNYSGSFQNQRQMSPFFQQPNPWAT